MAHYAIGAGSHTLGLAALSTNWSFLRAGTEVAKSSIPLRPLAVIASHDTVARTLDQIHGKSPLRDLLLPRPQALGFLTSTSLALRHPASNATCVELLACNVDYGMEPWNGWTTGSYVWSPYVIIIICVLHE